MRLGCPLSANRDHDGLNKDFGSNHIHGTHVPVEEPSTASKAEMTPTIFPLTFRAEKLLYLLCWAPKLRIILCIGERELARVLLTKRPNTEGAVRAIGSTGATGRQK